MQENTSVQLPSRRQVQTRLIRDFVLCALIFGTLESPRIVGYFRISQGLTQIRDYWDAWLEAPWLSLPVILVTVVIAACLGFVTAPLLQRSLIRWTAADAGSQVRRKFLRFQILAGILFTGGLILLLTAIVRDYAMGTWRLAMFLGTFFAYSLGFIR